MAVWAMTARRAVLRWTIMAATLIVPAAGLGSLVPAPHAAAGTVSTAAAAAGPARPVTIYVANLGSGTVTPIATATNTAGPPIRTGDDTAVIAITPDGRTAYVANAGSNTVTPIATATNTPGPAIPVGRDPEHIAIDGDLGRGDSPGPGHMRSVHGLG